MGGDGGVIASNRRYLRGAGAATTTADYASRTSQNDPIITEQENARCMLHCYLTDQPLQFTNTDTSSSIVVCPYGRLYHKEAAVEALLQRKQQQQLEKKRKLEQTFDENDPIDENDVTKTTASTLGDHIRGLKDLYDVRFETIPNDVDGTFRPICPVTHRELNGKIVAYAYVGGNNAHTTASRVNVVSAKAIQQMGESSIRAEYGPPPINDTTTSTTVIEKIRLYPPPDILKEIMENLTAKRRQEQNEQHEKKRTKKHKKKVKLSSDDQGNNKESG